MESEGSRKANLWSGGRKSHLATVEDKVAYEPKQIKKLLMSEIKNSASETHNYCSNSNTDLTRNRKLSMGKMLQGIIGMESKSLTNELLDLFHASAETPTVSAFIQQRNKIKPKVFESIFKNFSKNLMNLCNKDMPIFAVDGSDIQIPTNSSDTDSYIAGTNGHKAFQELVDYSDIEKALVIADRG